VFLLRLAQQSGAGISTAGTSQTARRWKPRRRRGREGRALTLAVMKRWGEKRGWRDAWCGEGRCKNGGDRQRGGGRLDMRRWDEERRTALSFLC